MLILLHGVVDLIRPRQDAAFEVFDAFITGVVEIDRVGSGVRRNEQDWQSAIHAAHARQ